MGAEIMGTLGAIVWCAAVTLLLFGDKQPEPRMMVLRGCPRCHGDLTPESDRHGDYQRCIQCGFHVEAETSERKVAV